MRCFIARVCLWILCNYCQSVFDIDVNIELYKLCEILNYD